MKAFQILLLTAMVTIAMKKCVAEYLLVEIEDAERRGSMLNARATNECSCSKWGEWGQCSESCGNGFMERVCINTAGQSGKDNCKETKVCQIRNNICEECPKRNGYFSKDVGYACDGRDELGLRLNKDSDDCQKACDAKPNCIAFETADDFCNLSSSCTYKLAKPETLPIGSSERQCLYVKQG